NKHLRNQNDQGRLCPGPISATCLQSIVWSGFTNRVRVIGPPGTSTSDAESCTLTEIALLDPVSRHQSRDTPRSGKTSPTGSLPKKTSPLERGRGEGTWLSSCR